jgi:quercetin dioxygenase-like cupin family protein
MTAPTTRFADLSALARDASTGDRTGAVCSLASADLNLNLVRFTAGDGVAEHVNAEVDVVGLVVSGAGVVEVDGRTEPVREGQLFFIPKGARRAIRTADGELTYLTCHRRREGLMPKRTRGHPPA